MSNFNFNNNRRYGIEIECFTSSPEDGVLNIITALREKGITVRNLGQYGHNTDRNNTDTWTIKKDSSISVNRYGQTPFEIVSPVLMGQDGLKQLKKVTDVLSEKCDVNKSCGVHVHHEATDLEDHQFRNIYDMYAKYQNEINMMLPKSRRDNQRYCATLNHQSKYVLEKLRALISHQGFFMLNHGYRRVTKITKKGENKIFKDWLQGAGRKSVNFNSYAIRGTIEFRQHSGTVSYKKIKAWVYFTQAIIEKCKTVKSIRLERTRDGNNSRLTDKVKFSRMLRDIGIVNSGETKDISLYLRRRMRQLREVA
jgi:hypothetical protein